MGAAFFMQGIAENIIVEESDRILKIILNRPENRNILNIQTRKEILHALKSYEKNTKIKCILLTANGEIFSAGADMKHLLTLNERKKAKEYATFVRSFLDYVQSYPKPTVGAVNGTAVGGGLELLLTLDIVISSSDARFGQTELNVGLIPGGGGSQRMPRIVGFRRAKEMIFTGGLISASEAQQMGLVNSLVERDLLLEEAFKVCQKIASKSALSLKLAKKTVNAVFTKKLDQGLRFESMSYEQILTSKDGREGMTAILEKRTPNYSEK